MSQGVQDRAVSALAGLLSRAEPAVLPVVLASQPLAGPRSRAALPALEGLLDHDEPSLRRSPR